MCVQLPSTEQEQGAPRRCGKLLLTSLRAPSLVSIITVVDGETRSRPQQILSSGKVSFLKSGEEIKEIGMDKNIKQGRMKMRMPGFNAEASFYKERNAERSLYRGGHSLRFAGGVSSRNSVSPATLICNSVCLASWGIGCAIFCRSDTNCLKQCGADAIKTCCIGSAPVVGPILA